MHQRYEGPTRQLVHHSGMVLRGLTYAQRRRRRPHHQPPAGRRSGRTWDYYRYTWVRDASMTLQGLYVAACRTLIRVPFQSSRHPARPRTAPAGHVRHRRRARPQRTAGAAPGWLARQRTRPGRKRRLRAATAGRVRRPARCRPHHEKVGAHTQSFGSDELDAFALLLVIMGFLPGSDPRLLATTDAIEQGLSDERGLIYRLTTDSTNLRAPSCCARSGSPTPSRSPGESTGLGKHCTGPPDTPRTSGSSPSRSTSTAASCSATSPKHPAISAWSTRPKPLRTPRANYASSGW